MDRPNQEAELPDLVEPPIMKHRRRSGTVRRAARVAWYVAGGVIAALLFVRGGSLATALIQGVAAFLGVGLLGRILLDKSDEMRTSGDDGFSSAPIIDEAQPGMRQEADEPPSAEIVEAIPLSVEPSSGRDAHLPLELDPYLPDDSSTPR